MVMSTTVMLTMECGTEIFNSNSNSNFIKESLDFQDDYTSGPEYRTHPPREKLGTVHVDFTVRG